MGSTGPAAVELDTTLRDLYAIDNPDVDDLMLVFAIPNPQIAMTENLPLSTTFPVQGPRLKIISRDSLARTCLLTGPESYAFATGNMPVVLFNVDPTEFDHLDAKDQPTANPGWQAQAQRVYDALRPDQRPRLSFVSNPSEIEITKRTKLVVIHPMDCLANIPHAIDPKLHYELQSKPGLALSGLPTPPTQLIAPELRPDQAGDEAAVDAEVERMLRLVRERALPFVAKMPQACAGQGVFVVRSETDRQEVLEAFAPEVKKMLQELHAGEQDPKTASLVLQNCVPSSTVDSLNLFVTKSGRPIFLGRGAQYMDARGQWNGNFISYADQDAYRVKYAGLLETLASVLHERGYYGPVGIDVMHDADGQPVIVDLNPRVTASYQLSLLRGHFYDRRGLSEAVLFYPLGLKCTREVFDDIFRAEITAGRVIVCGWCEGRAGPGGVFRYSTVSLVLGGKDAADLQQLVEKVNALKIYK